MVPTQPPPHFQAAAPVSKVRNQFCITVDFMMKLTASSKKSCHCKTGFYIHDQNWKPSISSALGP